RLRDADEVDPALLREAPQDIEAAVAADPDQRLDAEFAQAVDDLAGAVAPAAVRHREGERVAAVGGAENGTAEAQHVDAGPVEAERLGLDRAAQQPHRAVADAVDAPAIALDRAGHDGADHRIEAGAIAAAGQQ